MCNDNVMVTTKAPLGQTRMSPYNRNAMYHIMYHIKIESSFRSWYTYITSEYADGAQENGICIMSNIHLVGF